MMKDGLDSHVGPCAGLFHKQEGSLPERPTQLKKAPYHPSPARTQASHRTLAPRNSPAATATIFSIPPSSIQRVTQSNRGWATWQQYPVQIPAL